MRHYSEKPARKTIQAASQHRVSAWTVVPLEDNRPGAVIQQKQVEALVNGKSNGTMSWSHFEKESTKSTAATGYQGAPLQLVAREGLWKDEQAHYQSGKKGNARLDGDAQWLAIVRYCKNVAKNPNDTVNDVLARAKPGKGVDFDTWKGTQIGGDSQEAQHLIPASYASATLKLPYRQINGVENGKMLLAGRKEKGKNMPQEYIDAKKKKGKSPNRGILHIIKGLAHNPYNKSVEEYVEQYYKQNKLKIGDDLPDVHFQNITAFLRAKHKEHDGILPPSGLGVSDLNLKTPLAHHPAPASHIPPVHGTGMPVGNDHETDARTIGGGAGGALGMGVAASLGYAAGYTMLGMGAAMAGGALLGGLAGYGIYKAATR